MPNTTPPSAERIIRTMIRVARLRANGNRKFVARREERTRRGFETRLKHRYAGAFTRLDAFLVANREAGSNHYQRERALAEKEHDTLFFVLARLHARACLVASEIRALVVSGHASGAMSRWRTLHELAVVAMFLERHGKAAAERYLDHSYVMIAKAATEQMQHQEKLGFELISEHELQTFRAGRDALIKKYGDSFKSDYGWASDFLGTQKPNFTDIEKSLDRGHWKPYVRLASQSVHAGFHGAQYDLGHGTFEPQVLLAGPSNAGLVEPAQCTLIDLSIVAVTLLTCRRSIPSVVSIHVLNDLVSGCRDAFVQANGTLEGDERSRRV